MLFNFQNNFSGLGAQSYEIRKKMAPCGDRRDAPAFLLVKEKITYTNSFRLLGPVLNLFKKADNFLKHYLLFRQFTIRALCVKKVASTLVLDVEYALLLLKERENN